MHTYENLSADALRSELKYIRRKRAFISAGNYLPCTNHNWQQAAEMSYRYVDAVDTINNHMRLECGDWHPVPQNNPLTMGIGELRFCGTCADAAYRVIMLNEIAKSEKHVREALYAKIGWWRRWLYPIGLFAAASLLCVAAIVVLAATPTHQTGNFDPRSDDYADGQCP